MMYQTEIQFFWPLTEQIPLELDYTGCVKEISIPNNNTIGYAITGDVTWPTTIAPTLAVSPVNSIGYLEIGGLQIGQEKEPNFLQKLLLKLLGFNWKGKQ